MNKKTNLTIFRLSFGMVCTITLMHIFLSQYNVLGKSESIFYADNLINFATHFGVVFSFLTSFLFLYFFLATKNKREQSLSLIFSLFFAFLSFDEFIEIHENSIHLFKNLFAEGSSGYKILEYNWVVALSVGIVAIISLFILEIKREKEKQIRRYYSLGILFFLIVMCTELLSIQLFHKQPYYFISVTIEETSEMLGVSMFFYAALQKLTKLSTEQADKLPID